LSGLADFVTSPQWVAWRNEKRGDERTKVPYIAPGRMAEADNAATWLPHDQAVLIADAIVNGSGGGIGIELGQCGEAWIAGVDLDSCRDLVSGIVEPWATEVIKRLDSYAEVSPSRTGVKQFFLVDPAHVPALRSIMGTEHGRQFKRANGGKHPPSIELYASNRYFTVTWESLADAPTDLRVVPLEDLRWLVEQAGPAFSGKAERRRDTANGSAGPDDASTILGRLNTAAKHSSPIDTALRNASTLAGGSRSEGAFGLGAALKRAGWTFADMKAALLACQATHNWAADADERQFERIWNRGDEPQPKQEPPSETPYSKPDILGIWDAGDDDYVIPPRAWLLGTIFCRRFLSSLIADGGVGKTALRIAQLMSLATRRSLTGEHVFLQCRVLIVSLEDDADELRRRVYAVMRRYGIKPADVRGWLFLAAPKGVRLAEMKDGAPAASTLQKLLTDAITDLKIDVVSLDPFIKSHGLEENSNGAIDYVCTLLTKMAIDHDISVDLPHHTKKGLGGPGDADRGRGATAMKDAARLVYTLNPMTTEEAQQFDLTEVERRSLVRMDSGKVNIAPPATDTTWFRIIGMPLENGHGIYPAGDNVQTVEPWQPPKTWAGLGSALLNRILDSIETGCPDGTSRYSASSAAKDRAAWKVIVQHAPDRTEKQARDILKMWLKTGTLFTQEYEDAAARKSALGLCVNPMKRPT
jgi:hypothetical protein